ncbi:MAG: pyridoxamine 5'-phosphate oxidase family protein [Myxococcaceae bacterium]|nr:pyridoxamine 5'-phosphate oxidase family protein [Myxococcaceae bacterium]
MTGIRKSHRQHDGELRVQRRRGVPPSVAASIAGAISDDMPPGLVEFYRGLQFLPLAVTDERGALHVTLLCNPVTSAPTSERLELRARVNAEDPFVRAITAPHPGPRPFAGVAIDFSRRARVKLGGVVESAVLGADGTLVLGVHANEHMGNCPKYITARQLRPTRRTPHTTTSSRTLSDDAKALLLEASTLFVATRHIDVDPSESDLGLNHRGGRPGFVRYLEDETGGHLVLPDYSGNRFYQSLGNVETDAVMGLAVPDFASGALLQVSGRARNLFDDEADRLMPGATLVTVVSIDTAALTTGALDLELVGPEALSPYNPPVRRLARERPADRTLVELKAQLVDITVEARAISTFTFELPAPADVVPGGHAIFDFSEHMKRWYQHMNDRYPQSLNDDHVRTYTVSRLSPDRRRLSITVKKSGAVSSFLHSLSMRSAPLAVTLKGYGGTFTCFEEGRALNRMVWVAGGVGLTPFLAMYRALRQAGQPMPDVELLYACRLDEVQLVRELEGMDVKVFDSSPNASPPDARPHAFHHRRLQAGDLAASRLLDRATVFVCGPPAFMAAVTSWLEPRVDASRVRLERFQY